MNSTMASTELLDAVATEVALGVNLAVESWMAEIEQAAVNPKLTTLGRMYAVKQVLDRYKSLTGKKELHCRRPLMASGAL